MRCNRKVFEYLERGVSRGQVPLVVYGGRRAGKSYAIAQWLLLRVFNYGEQVLVVSITDAQGREGIYSDMCEICVEFGNYFEIHKTPREILCTFKRGGKIGRVRFSSFDKTDKAKGGAVDWVFMNEANLLSYQHYIDVSVNARRGVILDFNPPWRWVSDLVSPSECLQMTWEDNRSHLTSAQIAWFEDIKARAERVNATAADVYFYRVNYLGEEAELSDGIFTPSNLNTTSAVPDMSRMRKMIVCCDPSALCGNDYFACICGGIDEDGVVWVFDTFSKNACSEEEVLSVVGAWCGRYDVSGVYVETNGLPGVSFYKMVRRSGMPARPVHSSVGKFERITANYHGLLDVRLCEHDGASVFLSQIWRFSKSVDHDDNIDALNTFYTILKFY